MEVLITNAQFSTAVTLAKSIINANKYICLCENSTGFDETVKHQVTCLVTIYQTCLEHSVLADMTSDQSDKKQNSETKDTMGNLLCTKTQHRRKVAVPNKIMSFSTDNAAVFAEPIKTRTRVGLNIPKPTPSERSPLLVSRLRSPAPNVEVIPSAHRQGHQASRLANSYPVPYYNSRHAVVASDRHSPYTPMGRSRMDWIPSTSPVQIPVAPTPRPLPRPPCTRTPAPSSGSWSITTLDSSASSSHWTPNLSEPATIHHRPDEVDNQNNGGTAQEPKYLDIDNILIRFRKLTRFAVTPCRHTATGEVFVLFCAYKTNIPQHGSLSIPTDLQMTTPMGTYGQILRYDGFGAHGALRIMETKVPTRHTEPIFIWVFNDDKTRPCQLNRGDPIAALIIRKDYNPEATIEEVNGQIRSI